MTTTAFATTTFVPLRPVPNSNTISISTSTSGNNCLLCTPKRPVAATRQVVCAQSTSCTHVRCEPPILHTCTLADLPALADTAADAFHDDPVFQYVLRPVCRDELDYTDTLRTVYYSAIAAALADSASAVVRADSQHRALAIWYHPNGVDKVAKFASVWRLLFQLGPRKFIRLMQFFVTVAKAAPKQPYVYLAMIACCQDEQGKGLGSALMKEVVRECEERNVEGYLESSNMDNTEFYNNRGFRNIGYVEGFGNDGAPKIMRMWRSVQRTKSS